MCAIIGFASKDRKIELKIWYQILQLVMEIKASIQMSNTDSSQLENKKSICDEYTAVQIKTIFKKQQLSNIDDNIFSLPKID